MHSSMARPIAVFIMATLGADYAHAQPSACASPRKADGTMTESYYRGVESATDLISKQRYAEAIDRLTKMTEGGTNYEKAIVWYNLGFAYSSKNDLGSAAKAFQKALDLNAMPQQQHDQLLYNLGQLYIADRQFDAGIRTLERYIAESCSPVQAEAHIFLANAYTETKRYRQALPQVDLALSKAKQPKESWLQLKLAINYELKNYRESADTLIQLIGMAPGKPDYWKQLSTVVLQLNDEAEAAAVLALADRQGFLTSPSDIKNLYNMYMMVDLPFKAGLYLQDAIDKGKVPADEKNLSSVADAWINARESARAEATLKKLAAMSEKGEYYFKLGAMYGDDERWEESKQMLDRAIAKGGLSRPGEAYIRLAVAQYNLRDLRGAETALTKALGYDGTRNQASQWLRVIREESAGAPTG